jgi:hypothetical protein
MTATSSRPLRALLGAALLAGCVTGTASVSDPDPLVEENGPKFCNPTGKEGDDLRKCYEFNESLYKEFDEEAEKREPWFNITPDSWVASQEVDPAFVQQVTRPSEAVAKLEAAPVALLTPAEAETFTGKPAPETATGRSPYLVRALYYYLDTGAFAVFQKDQSILVRHDSVGRPDGHEQRSALVVYLPFKPQELYVDCQASE